MFKIFGSKDDQKAQEEEFNVQVRGHMDMLESQTRSLEAAVTSQELAIQKILQDSRRSKETSSSYPPQQVQHGLHQQSYNREETSTPSEDRQGYPGLQYGNPYTRGTCVDIPATRHDTGGTFIETILEQLLQQTQETLRAQTSSLKSAVEVHRSLLQKTVPDLKLRRTKDIQVQTSYNQRASSAGPSYYLENKVKLEEEYTKLKKEYDDLRRSKESSDRNYNDTILGMEKQQMELKLKIERMEKGQKQLETQNNDLKRSENKLKDEKSRLEKEKKALEKKVSDFEVLSSAGQMQHQQTPWYSWRYPQQPRKSVMIQIFCPRKTDLMTVAVSEMASMIRTQFDMEQTDLIEQRVENVGTIDKDKPVVVICMNASRLGTDVENALSGLVLNRKLAVVILHHKEQHALPSQSSDRVLTSPEYKQLGAIVDMAFLSAKGVYSCDMNNRALDQLKIFINSQT